MHNRICCGIAIVLAVVLVIVAVRCHRRNSNGPMPGENGGGIGPNPNIPGGGGGGINLNPSPRPVVSSRMVTRSSGGCPSCMQGLPGTKYTKYTKDGNPLDSNGKRILPYNNAERYGGYMGSSENFLDTYMLDIPNREVDPIVMTSPPYDSPFVDLWLMIM